jgi:hypothetical protein
MTPPRAYRERLDLSRVVRLNLRRRYWRGVLTAQSGIEVHASMSLRAGVQTDVRRIRERFLCEGSFEAETLPRSVLDSWRRSQAMRVRPDRLICPMFGSRIPSRDKLTPRSPCYRTSTRLTRVTFFRTPLPIPSATSNRSATWTARRKVRHVTAIEELARA